METHQRDLSNIIIQNQKRIQNNSAPQRLLRGSIVDSSNPSSLVARSRRNRQSWRCCTTSLAPVGWYCPTKMRFRKLQRHRRNKGRSTFFRMTDSPSCSTLQATHQKLWRNPAAKRERNQTSWTLWAEPGHRHLRGNFLAIFLTITVNLRSHLSTIVQAHHRSTRRKER